VQFEAVVHAAQLDEQLAQTVSAVAVHAVVWYWPAEQVAHGRHAPPLR
jgi:hypothetical protein